MSVSILRIKDKNGNWIPIPAIKGDAPYVGDNDNWWVGGVDTGVKISPRVVTGSYRGTGDNTIVLSFDFVPKCILIEGESPKEFGFLVPTAGSGFAIEEYVSGTESVAKTQGITCTVSGNTVTVKTTGNVLSAGSPNVATYNYVAFG